GAAEGLLKFESDSAAEQLLELGHDRQVGPCEPIYALPVIADREKARPRLANKTLQDARARLAGILELVHHHEFVRALPAPLLDEVTRHPEHVLKVNVLAFGQLRGPATGQVLVKVQEHRMAEDERSRRSVLHP